MRTLRAPRWVALVLAFVSTAVPARALTLTPTGDEREVSYSSDPCDPEPQPCWVHIVEQPSAPFAPFDAAVTNPSHPAVSQHSRVDPLAMQADGFASGPLFNGYTNSEFAVDFEVDTAASFLLRGTLVGDSAVQLFGGSLAFSFEPGTPAGVPDDFELTGILEPGVLYGLRATANGARDFEGVEYLSGRFELVFTVVPEPATGLLSALGLAGMAARRRLA